MAHPARLKRAAPGHSSSIASEKERYILIPLWRLDPKMLSYFCICLRQAELAAEAQLVQDFHGDNHEHAPLFAGQHAQQQHRSSVDDYARGNGNRQEIVLGIPDA